MVPRIERVRYRFVGRVRRRGFRYACSVSAGRAGATGWVRNERDGTVTAEVQGDAQVQLAFVRILSGLVPGFGDGWSVGSERPIPPVPGDTDFRVRRY